MLASTTVSFSSFAMALIAAAVYSPIPGSFIISFFSRGKIPLN